MAAASAACVPAPAPPAAQPLRTRALARARSPPAPRAARTSLERLAADGSRAQRDGSGAGGAAEH